MRAVTSTPTHGSDEEKLRWLTESINWRGWACDVFVWGSALSRATCLYQRLWLPVGRYHVSS